MPAKNFAVPAAIGLVREATEHQRAGRYSTARVLLAKAIPVLEAQLPDSEPLADAYRSMCFAVFFSRCRRANREKNNKAAAAWYEKAIAVWERNGNADALAGNLCNIGALYLRFGDYETALARNMRALEMDRQKVDLDDEDIASWNHVAGCLLQLGRLEMADSIVREGLARIGEDKPNACYLWATLAEIYQAHAERFKQRARDLAPPDACRI